MELIDRLKEVLKEEFNICSDEELLEAVQSMPELDLVRIISKSYGRRKDRKKNSFQQQQILLFTVEPQEAESHTDC